MPVELSGINLEDVTRLRHCGIIDQDVHRPKAGLNRVKQALGCIRLAKVKLETTRLCSSNSSSGSLVPTPQGILWSYARK
jgi:hypothetical protein